MAKNSAAYTRRRPEESTLYAVVRDNLATLVGAVEDGALAITLPDFVRKELYGYLECGMLCRGFARLRCDGCEESQIVAFSCKGRGFCPSCLGRKMAQTAAHLVEDVLPREALRQWVLTFPYTWRKRLGYDAELLSALTGIFLKTLLVFYKRRTGGKRGGKSGAVVSVQRTSSDLKLNPHLHAVFLDGGYANSSSESERPAFVPLGHLQTREVANVLETSIAKMQRYLRRKGLLRAQTHSEDDDENRDGLSELVASAVSGTYPPAGPAFPVRGMLSGPPPDTRRTDFERPLCVGRSGFTLHAKTHAGGSDVAGREALIKYILRPAVAKDRIVPAKGGLVRIVLKRAFSDGTVAIELDPLSLLSRLAASVPYPRFHTVRYAGVLASASKLRSKVAPEPRTDALECEQPPQDKATLRRQGGYRPWAELLKRTFGFDVLHCHNCKGRMRLLAMVTEGEEVRRYLRGIGEPTELPKQAPSRGPPYWQSKVLRRKALGEDAA